MDIKKITQYLVFDIKLGEDFRRKACYCADGHKTETLALVTYSTMVSRDSVRINLTIAALHYAAYRPTTKVKICLVKLCLILFKLKKRKLKEK